LFAEVAVGTHAGGFDHAAEGGFAPAAPGLVGAQDSTELQGFLREGLALLGEGLQVLADFTQRLRLGGLGGLQSFLVGFELLFEGFQQGGDGLLALGQIAFGRFLELAQGLRCESQELRVSLTEGIGAECLEGVLEIEQGLVMGLTQIGQLFLVQIFLFREQSFG
jgi:hypothetical protein